jgi:hypothetical protein
MTSSHLDGQQPLRLRLRRLARILHRPRWHAHDRSTETMLAFDSDSQAFLPDVSGRRQPRCKERRHQTSSTRRKRKEGRKEGRKKEGKKNASPGRLSLPRPSPAPPSSGGPPARRRPSFWRPSAPSRPAPRPHTNQAQRNACVVSPTKTSGGAARNADRVHIIETTPQSERAGPPRWVMKKSRSRTPGERKM